MISLQRDDLGFLPVVGIIALSALDGYAMAASVAAGSAIDDPDESEASKQLWRWKQELDDRWFDVDRWPKVELVSLLQRLVQTADQILYRSASVKSSLSAPWREQVSNIENNVQRDKSVFESYLASASGVNDALVSGAAVPDLLDKIDGFVLDVRALMGVLEYAISNDALQGSVGGVVEAFAGLVFAVADLFNASAAGAKALLDAAAIAVRAGAAALKFAAGILSYVVYAALGLGGVYLGYRGYKLLKSAKEKIR